VGSKAAIAEVQPQREHCERLGIRWTQSNARNISISHRTSVALMDEFIGPKR
jgi:hypothetical protein